MYLYSLSSFYPSKLSTGWTKGIQGICHDSNYWYIAQNGNLWKIPLGYDLNSPITTPSGKILKTESQFQFGDIDYFNGYIFVPVKGGRGSLDDRYVCDEVLKTKAEKEKEARVRQDDEAKIFIFRASDLKYVTHVSIKKKNGNYFNSLSWLAINNGFLYTSEKDTDIHNPIHVYSIGSVTDQEPLKFHATLEVFDEDYIPLPTNSIQGGCFDDQTFLHLSIGRINSTGNIDYDTGIHVFSIPANLSKNSTGAALRIERSYNYSQREDDSFLFSCAFGDVPAGLTYWDLSNNPEVPSDRYKSQLHAIISNKKGDGGDKMRLIHYTRNPKSKFYQVTITFADKGDGLPNYPMIFRMRGKNGYGTYQTLTTSSSSTLCIKTFEEIADLGPWAGFELYPSGVKKYFFLSKISIDRLGSIPEAGYGGYVPINQRADGFHDSQSCQDKYPDLGIPYDYLKARYITINNNRNSDVRIVLDAEAVKPKHEYFYDIELYGVVKSGKVMLYDLKDFTGKYKTGDLITLKYKVGDQIYKTAEKFIFDSTSYNCLIYEIPSDTQNSPIKYLGMTKTLISNLNNFKYDLPRIRYLSLENSSGTVAQISALVGPTFDPSSWKEYGLSGNITLGRTKKVDLAKLVGKISQASIVVMKAIVKAGDDRTANEYFYFDETSDKTACYKISGVIGKHSLKFKEVK